MTHGLVSKGVGVTGSDELEIIGALVGANASEFWEFGDRLNEYYFEYEPAKILFKILKEHWRRVQATPSQWLLKKHLTHLQGTIGPDLYALSVEGLERVYKPGNKTTETFLAEFIAGKEIKNFVSEVETLELGNYKEYVRGLAERLDRVNSLGGHQEETPGLDPFSHKFLKNWSKNVKESYGGTPVGTGYSRFDDHIDPLYPGELGLFIAPTGKGKSVWLTNLAWHGSFNLGLRVVYFALDNLAAEFAERLLTRATGIYIRGAKRKYKEEVVERKVTEKFYQVTAGRELRLHVRSFPRNTVSTRDIKKYIRKMRPKWVREDRQANLPEKEWGKVGLILVDYGDLMILDNPSGQDWLDRERIYNALSALGTEELCPVWTVSQTNTSGMMERAQGRIKEYHAAGGGSKLSPVRVGVSLLQTPEEKLKGIFSVYVWKATRSESGIVVPMRINYKKQLITERMEVSVYAYAGGTILSATATPEEDTENDEDFKEEKSIDPDIFSGVDAHFRTED